MVNPPPRVKSFLFARKLVGSPPKVGKTLFAALLYSHPGSPRAEACLTITPRNCERCGTPERGAQNSPVYGGSRDPHRSERPRVDPHEKVKTEIKDPRSRKRVENLGPNRKVTTNVPFMTVRSETPVMGRTPGLRTKFRRAQPGTQDLNPALKGQGPNSEGQPNHNLRNQVSKK